MYPARCSNFGPGTNKPDLRARDGAAGQGVFRPLERVVEDAETGRGPEELRIRCHPAAHRVEPAAAHADRARDYFVHFLENKPQGAIDQRVIRLGCNDAIDSGLYTFTMGDGKRVRARYTFVYNYQDGQWLIVSHHSSAMPEKE